MTAKRLVPAAIAIALLIGALAVLYRSLQSMTLADVHAALRKIPARAILGTGLATAVSVAMLGHYDHVATHAVAPGRVAPRRAFHVRAVSHAVLNTPGLHAVTGIAVRYRLYSESGLGAVDTARVTAIVGFCVALGRRRC